MLLLLFRLDGVWWMVGASLCCGFMSHVGPPEDRTIGHADLRQRYPRQLTVMFAAGAGEGGDTIDVRRGFTLCPVAASAERDISGLDQAALSTHGSFAGVERATTVVLPTKVNATQTKRQLQSHWRAEVATVARGRAPSRLGRVQAGASMYYGIISDCLSKCTRKAACRMCVYVVWVGVRLSDGAE